MKKRRLLICLTLVLALALVNLAGVTGAGAAAVSGTADLSVVLPVAEVGDTYTYTLTTTLTAPVTWTVSGLPSNGFMHSDTGEKNHIITTSGGTMSAGRTLVTIKAANNTGSYTYVHELVVLPETAEKFSVRTSTPLFSSDTTAISGTAPQSVTVPVNQSVTIVGYNAPGTAASVSYTDKDNKAQAGWIPVTALVGAAKTIPTPSYPDSSNNNSWYDKPSSWYSSSGRYSKDYLGNYYSDPSGPYYYDSSRGRYVYDPYYQDWYDDNHDSNRYSYNSSTGKYYYDPYGLYYYDSSAGTYRYDPYYSDAYYGSNRYTYYSSTGTYISDPSGAYYYDATSGRYIYDPYYDGAYSNTRYSYNSATGKYYEDSYGYYYYNTATGSFVYDPYYTSSSPSTGSRGTRYSYNSVTGSYYADTYGSYYYDYAAKVYRYDPNFSDPNYSYSGVQAGTYARVIGRSVTVRSGASSSYSVIGTLQQNEVVLVSKYSADGLWVQIGTGGWVSASYLQATTAASSTGGYFVNVRSSLNVRSGPGTSYGTIGSLKSGSYVDVVSTTGGWAQIRHGSGVGYVSSTYLTYSGEAVG